MSLSKSLVRLALSALLLSAGAAQAHPFWYEKAGDGLVLRHGELDKNLHEVLPGGIDRMVKLQTTWYTPDGEKQIALAKGHDRLYLPVGVQPGQADSLVSADLEFPMHDIDRDGKSMHDFRVPATRWVSELRRREPVLTLDSVPTGVRKIAGQPDEAYQTEGYNTTLSLHVAEGLEPLPVAEKTLPASVLKAMGITPPKH